MKSQHDKNFSELPKYSAEESDFIRNFDIKSSNCLLKLISNHFSWLEFYQILDFKYSFTMYFSIMVKFFRPIWQDLLRKSLDSCKIYFAPSPLSFNNIFTTWSQVALRTTPQKNYKTGKNPKKIQKTDFLSFKCLLKIYYKKNPSRCKV